MLLQCAPDKKSHFIYALIVRYYFRDYSIIEHSNILQHLNGIIVVVIRQYEVLFYQFSEDKLRRKHEILTKSVNERSHNEKFEVNRF